MAAQYKQCPRCSTVNPAGATACPSCGHTFRTQFATNPTTAIPAYGTQRESNGLAVTAMILGIVALVFFCFWWMSFPCAVLAIVFGVLSTKSAQRSMAIAGLTCGAISLGINLLALAFFGTLMSIGAAENARHRAQYQSAPPQQVSTAPSDDVKSSSPAMVGDSALNQHAYDPPRSQYQPAHPFPPTPQAQVPTGAQIGPPSGSSDVDTSNSRSVGLGGSNEGGSGFGGR